MVLEIGVEPGLVPICEWIDFEATLIFFEAGECGAALCLKAFAARNPRIEPAECAAERLDFAEVAAAIGVVRPAQAGRVFLREQIGIGAVDA